MSSEDLNAIYTKLPFALAGGVLYRVVSGTKRSWFFTIGVAVAVAVVLQIASKHPKGNTDIRGLVSR